MLDEIESRQLMGHARDLGNYLINELEKIELLKNVRGLGLMIGFDVPEELKDLRKNLLWQHHIFTGEAKPNVIRLLPALTISQTEVNEFLKALKQAIHAITDSRTIVSS